MVLEILGQIDRGHAALPQLPFDPVAVGEGGRESRIESQESGVRGSELGVGIRARTQVTAQVLEF
jgi:hypothetical protein